MPCFGSWAFAPYCGSLTPVALQGAVPSHLASVQTPISPVQPRGVGQLSSTVPVDTHTHLHTLFSLEASTGGFADWFTLEDDEGILHFALRSSLWLLDTDSMLKQRQTEDWTDLWHKDEVKGLFTTYANFGMENICDKILKCSYAYKLRLTPSLKYRHFWKLLIWFMK